MKRVFLVVLICVGTATTQNASASTGVSVTLSSPAIPHGSVSYHAYKTTIAINLPQDREEYYVYTPPNYDPRSSTKYPVLYLFHGFDQNALGWQTHGNAALILDELISRGKAQPMIVVMPLCYGDYKFFLGGKPVWLSPSRINKNVELFSRMLLGEIIPQVESAYKISSKREDQAIAGLSMGGREAFLIGIHNASKFAWVGSFSGAFPGLFRVTSTTPDKAKLKLLWIACGRSDSWVFEGNMSLIANLNQEGWPVTTVVTRGIHDWPVWQSDLKQFAALLFQSK